MTAALSRGAALRLLPPGATGDPEILRENLSHCTVSFLTPLLVPLIDPHGLRVLITAGSLMSADSARLAALHNEQYINAYGPTETTVYSSACPCMSAEEIPERVPIGKPLPGFLAYVLDGLIPCAIGVPGEICVGGYGVGQGYLNRPRLTEEKFINNPFGEGRLYRSGDIGRWLPDGNMEFLGRQDDQIKIRGYRVELGEVEAALARLPGVSEAVVTAIDLGSAGDKKLIGYIAAEQDIDLSALRGMLAKFLPDYMIPKDIMVLDALPVNTSGKVDRAKLPALPPARERTADAGVPKTREEALVAWVFGEVLDSGAVRVDEDFFELGGNSLRAIQAINMLKSIAGVVIPISQLFEGSTVREVAEVLRGPGIVVQEK
jgi:bacitracin synthase 3